MIDIIKVPMKLQKIYLYIFYIFIYLYILYIYIYFIYLSIFIEGFYAYVFGHFRVPLYRLLLKLMKPKHFIHILI